MARKPPRLKLNITAAAQNDINRIWEWHVENRSRRQAETYENFLISQIEKLATTHSDGRPVSVAPEYQFITARRSTRGHGHHVIYAVQQNSVEILRIYHTRQNWENRFLEGR